MGKAIGLLGDDIIEEAANHKKRKGKIISFYTIGAVAAVFVLVMVLSLVLPGIRKPVVSFGGEPLSGGVVIEAGADPFVRAADCAPLTLSLEVELHKKSQISVSKGNLSLMSGDICEYKGQSFETSEDTKLLWCIDCPEESESYTLSINEETFATVSFDQGRNVWMISGQ